MALRVPPQRRNPDHPMDAEPGRARHWARIGLGFVAVASYAWFAAFARPFSGAALISVLIPGAVIGALAYVWPPERIPPPDKVDLTGMSFWVIAIAALFEWEASAFRDNTRTWHPSLTDLINPLLSSHDVKSAAIVVWVMAGWGLVRR